jgi:predicted nuclease with TOPRIM domain
MPKKKETLNTRVKRVETKQTRLEESLTRLAENTESIAETVRDLSGKVEILLASQIRTDEILRTSGEKLDERIGKLVSAIGQLISRMPPAGPR